MADTPAQPDPAAQDWTAPLLRERLDAYLVEHQIVRFDPEARNAKHTHLEAPAGADVWRVQQMLVDPEMVNDWVAEFAVDVAASRARQEPVLWLRSLGPLA